ncbi:hypothetical protein QBC36DRAFT_314317 [Triangularia setosa]|uniref:Uncharacterized protein n=1 Tax=Triangularia setosa TaxID=2587417 RepID=A0AAN7A3S2_9PEZI|nr:hypothetical protein QBC36DRAFT_314317 [Podospora setosa]
MNPIFSSWPKYDTNFTLLADLGTLRVQIRLNQVAKADGSWLTELQAPFTLTQLMRSMNMSRTIHGGYFSMTAKLSLVNLLMLVTTSVRVIPAHPRIEVPVPGTHGGETFSSLSQSTQVATNWRDGWLNLMLNITDLLFRRKPTPLLNSQFTVRPVFRDYVKMFEQACRLYNWGAQSGSDWSQKMARLDGERCDLYRLALWTWNHDDITAVNAMNIFPTPTRRRRNTYVNHDLQN